MVFRGELKGPEMKIKRFFDQPVSVKDFQCLVESNLLGSLRSDVHLLEKNWPLLAYAFLTRRAILENRDKGLLETDSLAAHLEQIKLNDGRTTSVATEACSYGHNDSSNGQSSDTSLLPGLHEDTALDILAWSSRSDYANLACVNKNFKKLVRSGYLYRLRRRQGIVEHWIYLACILMPWEAFDPTRQKWMRLPRIPCDGCFTSADKESLAVGTELLVFGRELLGLAIWKYSLPIHNWSRCSSMELPRCLFGSSSLGAVAIVAGGIDGNGIIIKSAELYDSESGKWFTLPDMAIPRKMCSGFFMDGKFYVVGGISNHPSTCLSCGEEFNLQTRTWRRIENMYPVCSVGYPAMRSPPLVAVVNNQLYAADQGTNEVKKYDKVSNTWSAVNKLPVRADSSNGWGLAFKACGKRLLVIGGHNGREVIILHSWDPQDSSNGGEWSTLAVKERAGSFVYNCAVMGC